MREIIAAPFLPQMAANLRRRQIALGGHLGEVPQRGGGGGVGRPTRLGVTLKELLHDKVPTP